MSRSKSVTSEKKRSKLARMFQRKIFTKGLLVMIAVSLALSALIRIGEAGYAIAESRNHSSEPATEAHATPVSDISDLLAELQQRKNLLDQREAALTKRMSALNLIEEQVNQRTAALVEAEEKLAATMATARTAASDDIARLTSLYENMKPKQAVPLFEKMTAEFAAGFLSRMKPTVAAQIMDGLDPQIAYAISVVLAGRNSQAPKQ